MFSLPIQRLDVLTLHRARLWHILVRSTLHLCFAFKQTQRGYSLTLQTANCAGQQWLYVCLWRCWDQSVFSCDEFIEHLHMSGEG